MNVFLKIVLLLCVTLGVSADVLSFPTHKIHFEGEKHFSNERLEEVLSVETNSFLAFWKKENPRIKDKLIPTLNETLKSFYRSEGFYDMQLNMEQNATDITLYIKENQPVRIVSIQKEKSKLLEKYIVQKKSEIFRAKAFIKSKQNIIKALLKEGYCSYDLETKAYVNLEKHRVDLVYKLNKGEICHFGKLTLFGLKTIDDDVVISRVRALEGERFSTDLVQETSNTLYGLQAFDSVLINVDRKFYNVIPVEIQFEEMKKAYHFEAGAGYDTYVGARIHASLSKYNFMGNAQQLHLKSSWSQKEQLLTLNYQKPNLLSILDYSIDFGADIGYSNLEYDGFQEEKSFIKGYLAYKNLKLNLKVGMAMENIKIDALDNLATSKTLSKAVNEGVFLLAYPYIDIVYDARDSKLNPKYGYYLSAYGELGLSRDDDASVYMKTLLEGRAIYTFENLTLATVGKVGVVEQENALGLPESKLFFAGGSYSNRAYGYQEMGVIRSSTEESIFGASSFANLSFEADYPIYDSLYGAVFSDNTLLNEEAFDFSGTIISSVGLGVRYMTPIGPFKLDVGFNVDDPSIYAISFQIGQSF
jgi:translocation and assembly module TamA